MARIVPMVPSGPTVTYLHPSHGAKVGPGSWDRGTRDLETGLGPGDLAGCVRQQHRAPGGFSATWPKTVAVEQYSDVGVGPEIEVVLFDLGGVLVHFRGASKMGELAGISDPDEVTARWLACPWLRAFEMGRCGPDDFAAGMVDEWRLALTPGAFIEEFSSWPGGPMAGAEDLVRQVASEGNQVCAFSNTNSLHWEGSARIKDLMYLFDAAFLSFEMGMLKPDLEAFDYVARSLGLPPQRVLFLDDNQINVDAARTVGFSASRVLGVEQARIALIDAGVIGKGDSQPRRGDGQRPVV